MCVGGGVVYDYLSGAAYVPQYEDILWDISSILTRGDKKPGSRCDLQLAAYVAVFVRNNILF